MGKQIGWDFNITANVEVQKKQLDTASKILDDFYSKYEDRTLKVNVDDMTSAINAGVKEIQRLYSEGLDEANPWLAMRPEMKKSMEDNLEIAREFFNDFSVMFKNAMTGDKHYFTGLDDIIKGLNNKELAVAFTDIGSRFEQLKNQSKELFNELQLIGRGTTDWRGKFSLGIGDFDESDLQERIDVLKKLRSVQQEMLTFDSQMESKDFVSGFNNDALQVAIEQSKRHIEQLNDLNLETTTQLKRREELIDKVNSEWWDSDSQDWAKQTAKDEEGYNKSINTLKEYITDKQTLIQELRDNDDELFASNTGIDQYIEKIGNQIQAYEGYIKELAEIHNGTDTQGIGIANFSEVVQALREVKEAIHEIRDAFEPLTKALSDQESAMYKMVTSSVQSLDNLLTRFQELHQYVNDISKKDFQNVTQIVQKSGNNSANSKAIRTYKKEATELLNIITELSKEVSEFAMFGKTGLSQSDWKSISIWSDSKEQGKFTKDINKSKQSVEDLEYTYSILEERAQALYAIIEKLHNAYPGAIDISKLLNAKRLEDLQKLTQENIIPQTTTKENVKDALSQVGLLKSNAEQEFKNLRELIESTFDFSTIEPNYEHITDIVNNIYKQFEQLQVKIKALDFSIKTPSVVVEAVHDETKKEDLGVSDSSKTVNVEAQAMSEIKTEAINAAAAKEQFANANKKVKESADVSVDALKEEASVAESVAKTMQKVSNKVEASQEEIVSKYKSIYGGSDKVNDSLASKFNNVLKNSNIDVSSINAIFSEKKETVGKGKDKQVIYYDAIKLIAQGADELGKATTVTREYEVATGSLIKQMGQFKTAKDTFDVAKELEDAASKVAELEKRMGTFKINIESVKKASKNITDEATLQIFEKELDSANQKLKELKATLKSTHSLDPVVNAESMMSTLDTTIQKYRTDIKKFSDVEGFGALELSLNTIVGKIKEYNEATDGMTKALIVQSVNKEISKYNANLDLVKVKHTEENRLLREKEQEYNNIARAQKKLYDDKIKLEKADYGSADEKILQGSIQARQEEYEALLKNAKYQENVQAIKKEEIQLEKQLTLVADERRKKEEALAWAQLEQEENVQKEKEINAAYKERADAIKAETDAEKERLAAKKEAELFYQQEEKRAEEERKRIAAEEEAAWKEYRAEQEAAAQKDREINLAYEAKAAQEAVEAERELAQTRKEVDAFYKEEDQKSKNIDSQKQKELNDLYAQRKQIISEILAYTKKLSGVTDEASIKAAQEAIDSATSRLKDKNAEIFQYGDLVNASKLNRQDDSLTEGLRKFNWTSYINEQTNASKVAFQELIDLQDDYYKKSKAFQNSQDGGLEEERLLTAIVDAEKKYKQAKQNTNLTKEQSAELTKRESQYEEELASIKNKNADKNNLAEQKAQFKEIADWYDKYLSSQANIHKMDIDLSGKSYAAQIANEEENSKKYKEELLRLGVNIESIEKSSVLTQEQKNELLAKEQKHREQINKQISAANDEERNAALKEQEKLNKQNKNYGKTRYNQEVRAYDKIMANYRSISNESGISADFQDQIDKYEKLYTELGEMRKKFANDPDAVKDSKLTNQFQDTSLAAEKARKEIQGIINEANKLDQIPDESRIGNASGIWDKSKFNDAKDAMKAYADSVIEGKYNIKGFNDAGTEMYVTMKNSSGAVEQITIALKQASGELIAFKSGTKNVASGWDSVTKSLGDGAKKFASIYLSMYDFIRYFREGIEYVREIDAAMTELRKVTDETESTYRKFLQTASQTASTIGSTVKDFTTVASDFARLGYSIEESTDLAKTALIYENVGDGFSSVEEASESIISTMKAFGIEAEDTMGIVDRFNEVGILMPKLYSNI